MVLGGVRRVAEFARMEDGWVGEYSVRYRTREILANGQRDGSV
jgi:hypothetical protein